jgi:hypothetical protein
MRMPDIMVEGSPGVRDSSHRLTPPAFSPVPPLMMIGCVTYD